MSQCTNIHHTLLHVACRPLINNLVSDSGTCEQLMMTIIGAGGTGKTFTMNVICRFVSHCLGQDSVVRTAYLNSAARTTNGDTLHSVFSPVPLKIRDKSSTQLSLKHRMALKVSFASILILMHHTAYRISFRCAYLCVE
jgi:hypothetical protein